MPSYFTRRRSFALKFTLRFKLGTIQPMPLPWVAISAALILTPTQAHTASPQAGVRQVYGDLVVEAKSATFTEEKVDFHDGVRATFAGEILTADNLTIYPKDQKGEAKGHVLLLDPAGTLSAEDLSFSWKAEFKSGAATNVHMDLAGVMMEAAKAESIPGNPATLIFTDVYGTSCARDKTPLYAIRSPKVVFHPGKDGVIRHPVLYLFGHRIATLPTHHFSLDPRVQGIPMPGLALGGSKVGILWAPSVLLDKKTAVSANVRSFKGEPLTATAYVTRSYLSDLKQNALITPRSEFSERFSNSYYDNVRVSSPTSAGNSLRTERRNLAIGTVWNHTSMNDQSGARYSKAFDAVYEDGGPVGKLGYQLSARIQDIRREDEPFHTRFIMQGAIGPAPYPVAKNLFFTPRLDVATYQGTTSFGWARAEVGLYANPFKGASAAVGYAHGSEFGRAMYPADQLLIRNEGMARIDYNLGPRSFSYLLKRDYDRGRWYREYMARQTAGCLEIFVLSRQFPQSYQLGVTLRLDDFFSILRNRKLQLGGKQTASPTNQTAHVHP